MIDTVVRQIETAARNGGARVPSWFSWIRQRGLDRFREVGFPTSQDEEWRFTPVGRIARTKFALESIGRADVTVEELEPHLFGRLDRPRLVFVDGQYVAGVSLLPRDVRVQLGSLGGVLKEEPGRLERSLGQHAKIEATPFTALNAALMRDGGVVEVIRSLP